MITPQEGIAHVTADIAEVGALTRELAARYEGIFSNLKTTLLATLDNTASMAEAAQQTIAFTEAASAALSTSFPNQPVLACRDGCSACCHLFVAVPPGIAELISQHIEAVFTPAERASLHTRLVTAAAAAKAAPDPTRLRWRCPLLGDDERCTIYDVRPLSCRAFTSTSAARCQQVVFDPAFKKQTVEQNPAHFRVFVQATAALEKTALQRGLPAQQKGLAQALLDLLQPPETA